MMNSGAKYVHSVDISSRNIESTENNLKLFGHKNFKCYQHSLENLPFEDESFDVVWCNGVIMHTANPDKCLNEITRVLKVGGKAWFYVYGAGGIYWYTISQIRKYLKEISIDDCLNALKLMRYPVRYIAEFIDDWKVPYHRVYNNEELTERLRVLGYENATVLKRGALYDTSERLYKYPNSKTLIGEGDLRYLLEKTSSKTLQDNLSNCYHGSDEYNYNTELTDEFKSLFEDAFSDSYANQSRFVTLAKCAYVHKGLRDLLSEDNDLNIKAFRKLFTEVKEYSLSVKLGS